jgi:hypothetical protein
VKWAKISLFSTSAQDSYCVYQGQGPWLLTLGPAGPAPEATVPAPARPGGQPADPAALPSLVHLHRVGGRLGHRAAKPLPQHCLDLTGEQAALLVRVEVQVEVN